MQVNSERLWVLLGFLIGFYGNWYATLLSKVGESQNAAVWAIWGISAISLFAYCAEITYKLAQKTIVWKLHLSNILAIVHVIATPLVYYIIEGVFLTIFNGTGILLWATIVWYETGLRGRTQV